MYQVAGQEIALRDTLIVEDGWYPRVDGHTQQVYVASSSKCVSVVSLEDNRLKPQGHLTSVGMCYSLGVLSPDTLCACDQNSGTVSVVRVTDDTVTATLRKSAWVRDEGAKKTAVLGNTLLVCYQDSNLVVYENGVSSPGTMVTRPEGLQSVQNMSSDGVSRFFVCDWKSKAVFILDVSGKLCEKINIDTDSKVYDCTVGDGKLWVGCRNGDIIVMSPQ